MAVSDLYKVIKKEETYEYVAKLINKEVEQILSSNLYTMAEQLHLGKSRVDILDYIENLLEKDTPKKLVKKHFEMQGYPRFSYECPNCHKFMGLDIAVLKSGYCDRCGQALDWSEEVQEDE